ncbi:DNA polymerase III, subunits gamma and tau [Candidatus Vecturithrix granuli]|uniref:DNA polymerase III subunit gamma/tau n=1 Tax=Vecturithrix granuli TaxID=1499967 RepID=A0A081BZT9_VECG1|nr:DNA polymerase III, subunits gamma and tau [Candidatus Vecturithrix granuli]
MNQEPYEVIARKWRPQRFDDVIGQRHITDTLKNELQQGRIAHAFLFAGIRGIGKTSTARILAKALNCVSAAGPTPDPCNQCASCLAIKQGTATDVMEIDGASNRKIEHIRELRENIKFAPAKLRYKVYIIDEVHMLTREAFNALLKTLEEPPSHAIFILATTDVHKVPITITSRCQRFTFRGVGTTELAQALQKITAAESIVIDEQSLLYIARRSEGSIRDAQSILEQVISYCGKEVTQDKVSELLGMVGSESIETVIEAILSNAPEDMLNVVNSLVLQGHDLEQFYKELIEHFRNLLVLKMSSKAQHLIENTILSTAVLQRQIQSHSFQELQQIFKYLLRTEPTIKHSVYPRFTMEMALLQAAQLKSLESFDAVLHTLNTLGEKFSYFKQQPKVVLSDPDERPPTQPTDIIQKAIEIFQGEIIILPEVNSAL